MDHAALEQIEIDAMVDFFRAAPPAVRMAHGVDAVAIAGAHCLIARDFAPPAMFRRAAGLGVTQPAREADVEAIVQHMSTLGQQYCVNVSPQAEPRGLADRLLARGFTRGYAWMKFSRPCAPPLPAASDLRVALADRSQGEAFGRLVAEGFGFPAAVGTWLGALPGREGWICVLAFAGDKPVGAGVGYVHGDCAWLGFAATLPDYRRRGAQTALLARRLAEAAARGARTAVIETGERLPDKPSNSYRNILRAGFTERYLRQNLLSPVPAAGSV